NDAAIHDIGGQLWWCDLKRTPHGVNNLLDRLLDCLTNFGRMHANGLRDTRNQVAALYLHLALFTHRGRRSDLDLDQFGRGLTDKQVVVLAHELHDGDVQLVTARADRGVTYDTGKCD